METKPFWKSVSFWLGIVAALLAGLNQLVDGGIIPNEGLVAIIIPILTVIIKRGMVDSATVKGAALVEASKSPLPPPPQG